MKTPKKSNAALDQTARKNLPASATTLIANARNDITIPYFSGALQYQDDTLLQRGGGQGLKIYSEIKRDGRAYAVLQKRAKLLLARDWVMEPASDAPIDIEAADFCKEVINGMSFDRLCENMCDATLMGFSVDETIWGRSGNRIIPVDTVSHDQRRFVFGEDWRPRLLTMTSMRDGIELPDRKFIVHRFDVRGNNPYGLGLGTRLFWPVLFKREGIAFWLHFLDKYAEPTVIGKTPYGVLSDEQNKLLRTLEQIRSSAAMTLPIGTDVEFLEASRSGSVSYEDFLNYWDKDITIAVLGESLSTDIGNVGSKAASDTHADMSAMLVDSDGDLQADTLHETLLQWLIDYNFPGAGVPWVRRIRAENEKEKADTQAAKAGAATATNAALTAVIVTAGQIDDDNDAREYITSFGLTDNLSDAAIDSLVSARFAFMEGGQRARDMRQLAQTSTAFAALFDGPAAVKKKTISA